MTLFGAPDNPMVTRMKGSYANPHQTIAIQDIPVGIKQVFRLCRYYYNTDSLLRAIITKMSEYPITQLIQDDCHDNQTEGTKLRWDLLVNVTLNLRYVMFTIKVDRYVFGQSFHYLYYPFVRYGKCGGCGKELPLRALTRYTVKAGKPDDDGEFNFSVNSVCPFCKGRHEFSVSDKEAKTARGLRMVRLNPLRMELEYNPSSGARDWYWLPPSNMRQQFLDNVRVIVETTEMRTLAAVMMDRKIRLNPDRLWVVQGEASPGIWEGWAIPPIFPALEDVYYYKVLRRANEALAQEHVTPIRIVTPTSTGDASPQRTMNLSDWQMRMRNELQKAKRDPNYTVLSPVPMAIEQMGGNARVMMVAAEQEAAARVIAAAIGCPIEMIWGGLNWTGASVSLRVLENHFINEREEDQRLLEFLVPKIAHYYNLPRLRYKLSEFKMADDVQREANAINLMLQGFTSRKTTLPELGYDNTEEMGNLKQEHAELNRITMQDNVAAAHMSTIVKTIEAKGEILLQYELQVAQEAMQASAERKRLADVEAHVQSLHAKGYTTPLEFDQSAQILANIQPALQQVILGEWAQSMPFVTQLLMMRIQGVQQNMAAAQGAMANAAPMQSAGAAQGAGLAPAAGPYQNGTPDMGLLSQQGGQPQQPVQPAAGAGGTVDPGQALPEQRAPRREGGSPV